MRRSKRSSLFVVAIGLAFSGLLLGCQPKMVDVTPQLTQSDFVQARELIHQKRIKNPQDEAYMLEQMRLGILTLAHGDAQSAQTVFSGVYEQIRTQGLNRDKAFEAVVLNEDLKFWKGEPFEQALALVYYTLDLAALGQWDNARAAADNALFQLGDFDEDDSQSPETAGGAPPTAASDQQAGYATDTSGFTLGYLLKGLASQQLRRDNEANDFFNAAVESDPSLRPICDSLRRNKYNHVLIVSYGLGPKKVGRGADQSELAFESRTASGDQPLMVRLDQRRNTAFPVVCDINQMAQEHNWNNLQGLRRDKSALGTGLLAGSAAVLAHDQQSKKKRGKKHDKSDSDEAKIVAASMAVVGMILKAGAHIDTRYCDVLPQRVYLVPINITNKRTTVELAIAGKAHSRLVLAGLSPPTDGRPRLRYVRLMHAGDAASRPAGWATSGRIYYSNDITGPIDGPHLPYILGGQCVRRPSHETLRSYQQSGYLQDVSLTELEQLYRAEGILFDTQDQNGFAGKHVLEGGRSFVLPDAGTSGFARLLGQEHPPYAPQSQALKDFLAKHAQQLSLAR